MEFLMHVQDSALVSKLSRAECMARVDEKQAPN